MNFKCEDCDDEEIFLKYKVGFLGRKKFRENLDLLSQYFDIKWSEHKNLFSSNFGLDIHHHDLHYIKLYIRSRNNYEPAHEINWGKNTNKRVDY